MSRKGLMVILDGLGDRPVAELGDLTPLQAADTPFMDSLLAAGACGLTDPLDAGVAVDTPTGTALLLGVPRPQVESLARGPVEAAGVGLAMQPGDVAVRCNLATLAADMDPAVVLDRRAGRIREGTAALAAALNEIPTQDGISVTVRPASQHRAVLRLSGPGLSAGITSTDPGGSGSGRLVCPCVPIDSNDADQRRTALVLNRFLDESRRVLTHHEVNRARVGRGEPPANGLITRGAGLATRLDSALNDRGLTAAVVAGERTVVGLARLLGFRAIHRPEFTGMPNSDFGGKVAAALEALGDSDVVFLHVKAPDICAHDHDAKGKRDVIERVDGALAQAALEGLIVAVCSDHCTDSTTGNHSGDPVPALLRGHGVAVDAATRFDEVACASGGIGRISATAFVQRFVAALG